VRSSTTPAPPDALGQAHRRAPLPSQPRTISLREIGSLRDPGSRHSAGLVALGDPILPSRYVAIWAGRARAGGAGIAVPSTRARSSARSASVRRSVFA
jgi:hypothetical protein